MNKTLSHYLKAAGITMTGLICFQLIAGLMVFRSNRALARLISSAAETHYLTVPNTLIVESLEGPAMAMAGGLFFTLSLGALVCLMALGLARLYPNLPGDKKTKAMGCALLPAAFLVWINRQGLLGLESLACVLASALVFFLCRRLFSRHRPALSLNKTGWHLAPPLILALLLLFFARGGDSRVFSDFRDRFLMSNPLGMAINDFYYRVTLAPAEVFKSQNQKLIKHGTLSLANDDSALKNRLERELLMRDYLPVDTGQKPDLHLHSPDNQQLDVYHRGHLIRTLPVRDLLADPRGFFNAFSQATDRYAPFRTITGIALITGLPLLMYLILYGVCLCTCGLFMKPESASRSASVFCLVLGLVAFAFLSTSRPVSLDRASLASALASDAPALRTAAFRLVIDEELDLSAYPQSRAAAASFFVPERYWYARALAHSRAPHLYSQLIALLDDPHPNVRCQAFFALGMMGKRQAVPEIIRRIRTSDHWYVQWYAYRALKRLGWIQKRSGA